MVATIAFVLLFVALGLGTVLVAMRGGPRNMGDAPTRRPGAVTAAVTIAAAVFGVGAAVWISVYNADGHEKRGPGGVELTAAQVEGRKLFAHNCATCHTLDGASAVGKVGPNLDEMRPPEALVLNAIEMGRARGQGQMPELLLSGRDAEDVASFVQAVAGR